MESVTVVDPPPSPAQLCGEYEYDAENGTYGAENRGEIKTDAEVRVKIVGTRVDATKIVGFDFFFFVIMSCLEVFLISPPFRPPSPSFLHRKVAVAAVNEDYLGVVSSSADD